MQWNEWPHVDLSRMHRAMRWMALGVVVLVMSTGCASPPMPHVHRTPARDTASAATQTTADEAAVHLEAGQPRVEDGQPTGRTRPVLLSQPSRADDPVPRSERKRPRFYGEAASFNFSNEAVQAVAQAVLGEMLGQKYTVAPGVQGSVTLVATTPIPPETALRMLEQALMANGLRLIYSDGMFHILPADQALSSGLTAPTPRMGGAGVGFESKIVPLHWISAAEMEKLVKPYARPSAIIDVDSTRNQITFAGSQEELRNYLRIVDTFDVDWMASMTVALIPVPSGRASTLAADLEKIFGSQSGLPTAGMVRLIPLDSAGVVVAMAAQAHVLDEVLNWVDRLDAKGGLGARLYTYDLKYIDAKELARRMDQVVDHAALAGADVPITEETVRKDDMPADAEATSASGANEGAPEGSITSASTPIAMKDIAITAIEETNSVLVRANPSAWRTIREAIARLDVVPLQVHIEAQIAEVKMSGALRHGVSWFFDQAVTDPASQGGAGLPDTPVPSGWQSVRGSIQPATQGVGWIFRGRSAAAVIGLLDQVSDVRVLQTPSIFVRNNTEAQFTAGSRIPVVTVSLNSSGGGQGTYNQVQYLETGTLLKVKPRITRDGTVFLDIEQEISTPGAVGSGDVNGNVRIDTNKLKTQVTVRAGDTVMLAGLTRDSRERSASGAPGLARLPVIGGLFGSQAAGSSRDELVMLITASVAANAAETRGLTDEYLRRFKALRPVEVP